MCGLIVFIVGFIGIGSAQDKTPPAASQPSQTTRTSPRNKPERMEKIGRLLREMGSTTPILPVAKRDPIGTANRGESRHRPPGQGLMLEGTSLIERNGRLIRDGKKSLFEFDSAVPGQSRRRIQLLPNQFLEQMERQEEQGAKTFTITAEVTTYGGKNYLLLKKAIAIMSRGNLSP